MLTLAVRASDRHRRMPGVRQLLATAPAERTGVPAIRARSPRHATGPLNNGFNQAMIFASGRDLDATADVDPSGTDVANGFGDIFGIQSTGENYIQIRARFDELAR